MPKKIPPPPKLYMGRGETIEQAVDKAWGQAKRAGKRAGWYHVVSIEFYAENPIRDYKVQIGGGP